MKKMMLMAFAAMFTLSLCAQTPVRKCDKKCDKKCEKKCDKKCDGQKCGEKK